MDAWEDDFGAGPSNAGIQGGAADPLVDNEYTRIEQRYTDAGYREGITDGKLARLQEGFDTAFASSVPASRRLGQLRGRANALLSILGASATPARSARAGSPSAASCSTTAEQPNAELMATARTLVADLSRVRRADVLPIDHERLAHERDEHGEDHAFELAATDSREMEGLEDALGRLGQAKAAASQPQLREEALLNHFEERVRALEAQAGLA